MKRRATLSLIGCLLAGAASFALLVSSPGLAQVDPPREEVPEDDLFGDDGTEDGDLFSDEPPSEGEGGNTQTAPPADPQGSALASDGGAAVEAPAGDGGPTEGVEEILVTGEATEGAIIETNTSAVSFDADDLEAMGVEDVGDLAAFTPNLEIISPGATTATFFIRGVGLSDFSANAAGAVAIYQDAVPLNSPPLQVAQIFDVENIQVLRGPQGSGSGRNASAGAIKIYGRLPSMGENAARIRASVGKFESNDIHDAMAQDYEGALNVALLDDILAGRFAFRFTESDPFMTNRCSRALPFGPDRPESGGPSQCGEVETRAPNPTRGRYTDRRVQPGLPRHVGDREVWAMRGALRFQPPDTDMDWVLNAHGSRRNQDGTLGQAIGTGQSATGGAVFGGPDGSFYEEPDSAQEFNDLRARGLSTGEANRVRGRRQASHRPLDRRPFHGDYDRTGHNRLDTWGGFLRGEMGFDGWQLRTTTAYDAYKRDTKADTDFTPNVLFETGQDNEVWQVFQEFEASGELDDHPVSWSAGAYTLIQDLRAQSRTNLANELNNLERTFEEKLTSAAIHAGFEWTLLDDFVLEAGGRYNLSHKQFKILQRNPLLEREFGFRNRQKDDKDKLWDHFSGTVSLTYHVNDEASVYGKFNHGWKSGHFNTNGVPRDEAAPEKIDALEFGTNLEFFDGRARVRSAVFYYNYEDYQVFIFEDNPGATNPPSLEIINADDAQLFGVEADFTFHPLQDVFDFIPPELQDLEIELLFSWLDTQFLDFTNTQFVEGGTGGIIPVVVDYTGNQLPNAPELNLSGHVQWTFDGGKYGTLTPRWDFAWKDDVFFDPSQGRGSQRFDGTTLPDYAVGQPAYWLHNVRLGWRSADGQTGAALWCRNVTDTRYKNYAFDASRFQALVINFVGDPRSCGFEMNFSW